MIKASVIISSYNCNKELKNTFYAISRQKTNFEFEVCYIDDCSYEDPKFIYDNFLRVKHKKGIRLKQHIGSLGRSGNFPYLKFKNSFSMLLDMVSPESEIIILNHGDVLMTTTDTIQRLVDEIEEKVIKVPQVYTINVPEDIYINFDERLAEAIEKEKDKAQYQSFNRDSLAFTLMCLYKKDLYELEFDKNPHEYDLKTKINKLGYKILNYENLEGIHQKHQNRACIHFLNPDQALNWSNAYPEKEIY